MWQGVAIPRGVQYVPMISKAQYATASAISAAKATGSGVLLGYNEPDISTQGNNTVAVTSHLAGPGTPCCGQR